jgi:hypothetical protein
MKNNKTSILSLIFVMATYSPTPIDGAVGDLLNKITPDGAGVKMTQEAGKVTDMLLQKHLPALHKTAVEASSSIASDAAGKIADGITEAAPTIGSEAAGKFTQLGEKLAPAVKAIGFAYAASQVWSMGKDMVHGVQWTRSYFWPTEQEKKAAAMHAIKVNREYEAVMAEIDFKHCLKEHARSERNQEGMPSVCQSLAQAFAMAAGAEEADKVKRVFREYF